MYASRNRTKGWKWMRRAQEVDVESPMQLCGFAFSLEKLLIIGFDDEGMEEL